MAHRLRFLRLDTVYGQVGVLTTAALFGGYGITLLREDKPISKQKQSQSQSRSMGQTGDIVDAVQRATLAGQGQSSGAGGGPTLADALTAERSASLWWNYARDSSTITARLVSRDKKTTLLVPTDKAMLALGRKPHQHPGLSFRGAFSSSKTNTERFLNAHMIESALQEGKISTLLDAFTVELTKDQKAKGGWRIQPGDIEVVGTKETANGRILYLNKVIPY